MRCSLCYDLLGVQPWGEIATGGRKEEGGKETCQEVGGLLSRVQVRAVQVDLQSPCRAARAVPLLQIIRVTGSQGAEAQVRSWAGAVTAVMSWPRQRPSVLDSCPGPSALD